jgi:hypothetical protein
MTKKLFHFHNAKAAGTSFANYIKSHYEPNKISPLIENNVVQHIQLNGTYTKHKGYELYSGHYGYDVYSCINDNHAMTTNFREPVQRIISLYNYFRQISQFSSKDLDSEEFYCVKSAKTMDFDEFVMSNHPQINIYVQNFHFRQITQSCWDLENTSKVSAAKNIIDKMPFYFVTEHPAKSLAWSREWFKNDTRIIAHENKTEVTDNQFISQADLSYKIIDHIRTKNNLDLQIYDYAHNKLVKLL